MKDALSYKRKFPYNITATVRIAADKQSLKYFSGKNGMTLKGNNSNFKRK